MTNNLLQVVYSDDLTDADWIESGVRRNYALAPNFDYEAISVSIEIKHEPWYASVHEFLEIIRAAE